VTLVVMSVEGLATLQCLPEHVADTFPVMEAFNSRKYRRIAFGPRTYWIEVFECSD
jgi:hypothetical protein